MKQKRLALSMRGGGAPCLSYLGFLQLLAEEGIKVDFIIGSSVGALVGTGYAAGIPIARLVDHAATWQARKMVSLSSIVEMSLLDNDRLMDWGAQMVGDTRIEDLNIKTWVQVTNMDTAQSEIIDKGTVKLWTNASCSHPLFTRPMDINGTVYADGDLSSGYRADFLRNQGAQVVIGLCSANITGGETDSELDAIVNSFGIYHHQLLELDQQIAACDLILAGFGEGIQPLDFPSAHQAYDQGYAYAKTQWGKVNRLLFPTFSFFSFLHG